MTKEEIEEQIVGTNIDPRSFLSTDYFNHFNEVIMLLNMVADMPDILDDIDKWDFKTYRQHFVESGLGFAPIAIEAYNYAPVELRDKLERLSAQMSMLVVETRIKLRQMLENADTDRFREIAMLHSMELQGMVDDGGAIVHGYGGSADQSAIDAMF